MNLINKPRGTGKTVQLIYTSATTGYPIVCHNIAMIENIKSMADKLGCDIPKPVTVAEMRNGMNRGGKNYENVLVNEVMLFFNAAINEYLGANVIACTCTIKQGVNYD